VAEIEDPNLRPARHPVGDRGILVVDARMVMRATASLVVTVVAAIAIAAGTGAPSGPPPSSAVVSYRGVVVRGVGDGGQPGRRTRRGQRHLVQGREETTMTEYLIAFNDEWVPTHTLEELREKSKPAWP
jgi:hypothetical protein